MNPELEETYYISLKLIEVEPVEEAKVPEGVPENFVFGTNFKVDNLHIYAHMVRKYPKQAVISPVSKDDSKREYGLTTTYSLWVDPELSIDTYKEFTTLCGKLAKEKRILLALKALKNSL